MFQAFLNPRPHHQQAAMFQPDIERRFGTVFPAPAKWAAAPQADGSNTWGISQLWFVVTMPAHAFIAVAVAIEQNTVEAIGRQLLFQTLTNLLHVRVPGLWREYLARIAVVAITHPYLLAWNGMLLAVQPETGALPIELVA